MMESILTWLAFLVCNLTVTDCPYRTRAGVALNSLTNGTTVPAATCTSADTVIAAAVFETVSVTLYWFSAANWWRTFLPVAGGEPSPNDQLNWSGQASNEY